MLAKHTKVHVRELFPSTNEATLIKLLKCIASIMESFLCRLFFKMIETNYVQIYMKINYIFSVIYIPVMNYNIVFHSTLYLYIMSILLHNVFALISVFSVLSKIVDCDFGLQKQARCIQYIELKKRKKNEENVLQTLQKM